MIDHWSNDIRDDFWNRIDVCNSDECWNWHGAITSSGGSRYYLNRYGKYVATRKILIYLEYGVEIDFNDNNQRVECLCANKLCCNPSHLYVHSHSDERVAKNEERLWNRIDIRDDFSCWEYLGDDLEYPRYEFNGTRMVAHRAVYLFALGDIPNGLFVCHHCDNVRCCNPNHLFLGTHQDNMDDMVKKQRRKGELHNSSKLTWNQVNEIRRLDKAGIPKTHIAKEFPVTDVQIGNIVRGISW